MQGLWSRVLAGEANSPGAFSKRTLNFLPNLEKAEAESFTRLCGFVCVVEGNPQPLIHKVQDQIHKQQDLTFDSLKHLEAIGLIHFQGAPLAYSGVVPNGCVVSYYDKRMTLVMPKESGNPVQFGAVLFTQVGFELSRICGSQPVDGFFEYVLEKWKTLNSVKEYKTE